MRKTVAIIGAGIAGLATARIFDRYGIIPTVFEKESELGGVWTASRRYPWLTTQNPKDTYRFTELKMSDAFNQFPYGYQVQRYLDTYAQKFGLKKYIKFKTKVIRTALEGNQWTVSYEAGIDNISKQSFDFLIVCNGIFSEPEIPYFEGCEDYINGGGSIIHSSQFNDKQKLKDKTALIIGYGKSALDVAEISMQAAKKTTVIARRVFWKMPRKFLGIVNMKYLLMTRLGENLLEYHKLKGMAKFLHGTGNFIRKGILNIIQAGVVQQYKLKEINLKPDTEFETIARANVSLASEDFFKNVRNKKLDFFKTSIARMYSDKSIEFTDGNKIKADYVICGTGWRQEIPFFDKETKATILNKKGRFRLYKNQLPVDLPNIGFNGYNSSLYCPLSAEIGALWLAEHFTAGFALPSIKEMDKIVEERLEWSDVRTEGRDSKGANLIPFTMNHIDYLLEDMSTNVSTLTKLKQWLLPVQPSDYKSVVNQVIARFKENREADFLSQS